MTSVRSPRSCKSAAWLPTAIALAFAVSGCGGKTFSAPTRELPERKAIVMDPVRGDPSVEGRDLALIAFDWRSAALENERRLDLSACNYLDLRASYAAGTLKRTDEPTCVRLRKRQKGN